LPDQFPRALGSAVGVGKDEQPLSAVRRALLLRTEHVPFRIEPEAGNLPENFPQTFGDVATHVLDEEKRGPALTQHTQDVGPEVAGVVGSFAFSGQTEGLAQSRVARSDEIHDPAPRATTELLKVAMDRSRIQEPLLHSLDQDRGGIGFPLHPSDGAVGGAEGQAKSEIDTTDARAEGEPTEDASGSDPSGMCSGGT
jgi:hypothetical protein